MSEALLKKLRRVEFWQADCNVRMRAADYIEELEAAMAKAAQELEDMQKVPRSDASHGILMLMLRHAIAGLKGQDNG